MWFPNNISKQQCLLAMPRKSKKSVDSGKTYCALPTDLLERFDCLDHDLLIATENAYCFSLPALKLDMMTY